MVQKYYIKYLLIFIARVAHHFRVSLVRGTLTSYLLGEKENFKMKKVIIVLLVGIFLVSFSSCARDTEGYSMRDALKISTWVLNKSFEDTGYWTQDDNDGGGGHWISYENDRQAIDKNDVFIFERLKINEIRTLAPLHYTDMLHINIFFEFDGIIEVETEDKYIYLTYDEKNPDQPLLRSGDPTEVEGSFRWPRKLCINFCPLDEYSGMAKGLTARSHTQIGREYHLNVNAYTFQNEKSPAIMAVLKLVVLEDKGVPLDYYDKTFGVPYGEASRFLSIEIISYEYSDRYKFIDEIWDDE